jgi:hypothetical protein
LHRGTFFVNRFAAVALAALVGVLATACGASTGSATPTPIPSLPTASGGNELQSLLPDKVGSITLQKASMTGEQFVGSGGATQEAQTFLQGLGVSAQDVTVAIGFGTDLGSGSSAAILLFRARGASSDRLLTLFEEAANRDRQDPLAWQQVSIGGKTVEKASDPQQGGAIYLYATGDLLAFVTAGSDDNAAEALSALP